MVVVAAWVAFACPIGCLRLMVGIEARDWPNILSLHCHTRIGLLIEGSVELESAPSRRISRLYDSALILLLLLISSGVPFPLDFVKQLRARDWLRCCHLLNQLFSLLFLLLDDLAGFIRWDAVDLIVDLFGFQVVVRWI